jgi:hypothetical protein
LDHSSSSTIFVFPSVGPPAMIASMAKVITFLVSTCQTELQAIGLYAFSVCQNLSVLQENRLG